MNEYTTNISVQEQTVKKFMRDYLNKRNDEQKIPHILAELGGYYNADCAYIFELNEERTNATGICEWRRDGVFKETGNIHNNLIEEIEFWLEEFTEKGEFFISSVNENYGSDSKEYKILKSRGAESLMAAPVIVDDVTVAFLGVDNPRANTDNTLLLSVAATACYSDISAERTMKLNLKKTCTELSDQVKIIRSLSEIYTSVYYIDMAAGVFSELSSFDNVHTHIGSSGNAQERLNYFCHNMMMPEYTEEMLEFVDLSTLDKRLGNSRIVTKQFLSTVMLYSAQGNKPVWTECCFIESDRTPDGKLYHVIFATRTIHDQKVRELEAQHKLQETNRNLTALLASEKKLAAIVGALNNAFFSIYYINLEENTSQKFTSRDKINDSMENKKNAREELKHLTDELVGASHQSFMRIFMDFDTLGVRLNDKSIILREFIAKNGGWMRCSFLPVEKDKNGKNTVVLCTLRWITADKEEVESQDNLIQALAITYENIYMVNSDTHTAVNYCMGKTINDRYGQTFATGNYEQNMQTYIENEVYEKDKNLFDRVCTVSAVNELLADQKTYSFSYRVFRNELVQYFQCQLVKLSRERNEFVICFKNINDEKKQELAQQQKIEEVLATVKKVNETLLEEMSVSSALSQEYSSLFKLDAKTHKISLYRTDGIGIHPATLKKLLELKKYETVISRYIDNFVVPEDRERLREYTKPEVLMERVPDIGLYKLGYKRIMKGVVSYYEMNVAKTVDNNGQITFIIGLRDVDNEIRRQLKQTRKMEMQREIIEGLGSEYYSVLLVNPRTDKVTTYRAEDDEGRSIAEYFHKHGNCWSKGLQGYAEELVSDSSRSEFMEKLSMEHIRSNKEDYSLTYEKLTKDGVIYLQVKVSFVNEKDGGLVAVVGTRNVDDLIKKERQQEVALRAAFDAAEAASRAKTEFLSNMSHDIRTPLNGIIGMTAIAAAHINDMERVQDSLQKITQASKHLLSLINEVLDMSKIESGKVELVEEEFNLSDLVDNLITMISPQIEAYHHEFKVSISGVNHEAVIGDSLRIQKIFMNLMGNAVKFTHPGGKIKLSISEKPSAQPKFGCFEFIFEDNGIGMNEDFLEQVFDPFARAENARVNRIQGTGLGLAISRNIVRMMGGDIKVESKIGVGSRFTVIVYLKLQDTEEIRCDKFIDLNVLVADDDTLSLETCCGMLNDLGMKAEGVSTGVEAVEKVVLHHQQKHDYFACIIDWKIPDMDGIAITRAIRKSVGKDVPIIIISAYDWSDIEHEARAAGANAFISKPLFRSRLAKTFSTLLGEEENKKQEAPFVELKNMNLMGYRALLVEDNELNAEIATEILGMTGLDVERAVDGKEAVDMMCSCDDGYYDIIFMDIQMPNMNGYDAVRAIRAMDCDYCKQVPVIAMTANAFAEDIQAAKTVGMNGHIAKPLDLNVLAKTLDKWLCKK